MPRSGRPMSVRMCNLGPLGWVTDRHGYRYQATHPDTGRPWPPIPASLLDLWDTVAGWPAPPEACLVNLYRGDARMGLHQDRDEADLAAPVLSVSLGDDALFRLGGTSRKGPTPLADPAQRRRRRARRRGAPRLPRGRPGAGRDLGPRARRRPDQPDAAPGNAGLTGPSSAARHARRTRNAAPAAFRAAAQEFAHPLPLGIRRQVRLDLGAHAVDRGPTPLRARARSRRRHRRRPGASRRGRW